jgi:hypothetical protein
MALLPKTPKKPVYGPPEKSNWVLRIFIWLAILCAIGGIGWMVWREPREKPLVCDDNAVHSLWSFGTCTEEQ